MYYIVKGVVFARVVLEFLFRVDSLSRLDCWSDRVLIRQYYDFVLSI